MAIVMKIVLLFATISLGSGLVINQTNPEEAFSSDLDTNLQKSPEKQINKTDGNNWTRPLKLIEEPFEDILEELLSIGSISEVKAKIEELKDNPKSIAETIGNVLGSFYQMKHKNILGETSHEVHNGPKVEEHQAFLNLLGEKEHIQEALENILGKRVTPQAQRLFEMDREAFLNILEVSPRTRRQFSPEEKEEKETRERITTLFHNIFKDHINFMLASPAASKQSISHEDKQAIRQSRSRDFTQVKPQIPREFDRQSLLDLLGQQSLDLLGQQFSSEWQSQSQQSGESKHIVDECYQEACEGRACQCCNCITCWTCNVDSSQPSQTFSSSSSSFSKPSQTFSSSSFSRPSQTFSAVSSSISRPSQTFSSSSFSKPSQTFSSSSSSSSRPSQTYSSSSSSFSKPSQIISSSSSQTTNVPIHDLDNYKGIKDECYEEACEGGKCQCCNCVTCWSCFVPKTYTSIQVKSAPIQIKPAPIQLKPVEIKESLPLELLKKLITLKDVPHYSGLRDSCYQETRTSLGSNKCCNCITCWSCFPAILKPKENNVQNGVELFWYEGVKDSCYERHCEKSLCQCCNCVTCWSC